MAIVHIVLFEFKSEVPAELIDETCKNMMALREQCVHPTTQQPYVKSLVGGKNNSPEGHAGGLSHGFVVGFDNEEDREYYLNKDPAHLAFVKSVGSVVQNVRVFDFTPGKF